MAQNEKQLQQFEDIFLNLQSSFEANNQKFMHQTLAESIRQTEALRSQLLNIQTEAACQTRLIESQAKLAIEAMSNDNAKLQQQLANAQRLLEINARAMPTTNVQPVESASPMMPPTVQPVMSAQPVMPPPMPKSTNFSTKPSRWCW